LPDIYFDLTVWLLLSALAEEWKLSLDAFLLVSVYSSFHGKRNRKKRKKIQFYRNQIVVEVSSRLLQATQQARSVGTSGQLLSGGIKQLMRRLSSLAHAYYYGFVDGCRVRGGRLCLDARDGVAHHSKGCLRLPRSGRRGDQQPRL
jgi:hypothetical protein